MIPTKIVKISYFREVYKCPHCDKHGDKAVIVKAPNLTPAPVLPINAPAEYADRFALWNAVEAIEKSKNSQLAREVEIALPNELSQAECIALTHEFVQKTFVNKGMCADICIHDPNREQKNIHAHIMLTMRPINEDGTWGDKQRKVSVFSYLL